MEDHDRVSQASSNATVSFLPIGDKGSEKVQTFGKRCQAVKRDPNCPVVIRGWLYKRDSTGLRLWKRRWFVLSNYCLYYYKDSREETILGSVPLPSYRILFCSPRECRNRKYAFKVVHQGMRPYIMSAETQEDMLGWVRALSQSACMDDDIINRRCSSFQDFTRIPESSKTMELHHRAMFPDGNIQNGAKMSRVQTEPMLVDQERTGSITERTPEQRGRHRNRPRASEGADHPEGLMNSDEELMSLLKQKVSFQHPLFPRDQCAAHCPGTVWFPENRLSAPGSPWIHKDRAYGTEEPFQPECPGSRGSFCYCNNYHMPDHMTLCMAGKSEMAMERQIHPMRDLENDTDVVLTQLCGCDKLLQSVSMHLTQLLADKKSVEYALEVKWLGMEGAQDVSQKALLQEELVTLRARICDLSLEMERLWSDYERMESELSVFYSHLQHILHFGSTQEQIQAQKQLWMMEDILCGLRVNKNFFMALLGVQAQGVPHPRSVSCLEGELDAYNMEHVTKTEQDFLKIQRNYKRWSREESLSSEQETHHEPVCLTRVVTSTLPESLIAERIFVHDPYPEPLEHSQKKMSSERAMDDMRHGNSSLHWSNGHEEMQSRQNPLTRAIEKPLPERMSWNKEQELSPGILNQTNPESECEIPSRFQRHQTKPKDIEKRDRHASAAREHFIEDFHPLKLITAMENETDAQKRTPDSTLANLSNGKSDGCNGKSHRKESATLKMSQNAESKVKTEKDKTAQQSSCDNIIIIESHSINHVSTLTVFKGPQGNNQTHKSHKKVPQKNSASANMKSESFLSKNNHCKFVPVHIHEPKPQASIPPTENLQEQTNHVIDDAVGGDRGESVNQNETTKSELRIYEEIHFNSPTSGEILGNQDAKCALDEFASPNSKTKGEKVPKTIEKRQTGSDVMCKRDGEEKVYSSLKTSSAINNHIQDSCRPRITLVSTSL